MSQQSPIAVELFAEIPRFCEKAQRGVRQARDLIDVVEKFYEQFFDVVMKHPFEKIGLPQGLAREPQQRAARLRLRLGENDSRVALIAYFEEFCERQPDLNLLAYVPSETVERMFYAEYMKRFLQAVAEWSKTSESVELRDAVERAVDAYEGFLENSF